MLEPYDGKLSCTVLRRESGSNSANLADNFDLLNAYPEQEWHGGKVHQVRPHILHLMRGQIFEIGGLTWFAMGGAASHDIEGGIFDPAEPDFEHKYWWMRRMGAYFRVLGQSWWPIEFQQIAIFNTLDYNMERIPPPLRINNLHYCEVPL